MEKRRIARQKAIRRAYIARAIVAVILLLMLTLMFCGCLYIRDLFRKDDVVQPESVVESQDTESDYEVSKPDADTEEEPELEQEIVYTQYPGVSIVVDPGHGGNDGGTTGNNGAIIEKEINLAVSLEVKDLLEKHGVNVILTRDTDDYMSLEERAYFSSQTSADLFVSLHCNYFEGDESIDGLEAFYCRNADESRIYAESIAAEIAKNDTIALRGATENNHYVTRHAGMDAILIEMGFLSNPTECAKLSSPDYQKLLASSIVNGLLAAFESEAAQ